MYRSSACSGLLKTRQAACIFSQAAFMRCCSVVETNRLRVLSGLPGTQISMRRDRPMRKLFIDGKTIQDDGNCYVIAEIGHNHQGDLETAKEMLRVAKECGADAVKLQKRDNSGRRQGGQKGERDDNERSSGTSRLPLCYRPLSFSSASCLFLQSIQKVVTGRAFNLFSEICPPHSSQMP